MGFTGLADAQRLFGEPDVVSIISFKVDDLYRADQIGRAIEQAAGPGFLTTNWMEQNRALYSVPCSWNRSSPSSSSG